MPAALDGFVVGPSAEFREEHEAISAALVEVDVASLDAAPSNEPIEFKKSRSMRSLLARKGEPARRALMAVLQRYVPVQRNDNEHDLKSIPWVRGFRLIHAYVAVMEALLRKSLPLRDEDLVALHRDYGGWSAGLVKASALLAAESGLSPALVKELKGLKSRIKLTIPTARDRKLLLGIEQALKAKRVVKRR